MAENSLTGSGPWKWTCPKCGASGVITTKPQVAPDAALACTACALAGRGVVELHIEEVPRGLVH
jgi:hypothetical protein